MGSVLGVRLVGRQLIAPKELDCGRSAPPSDVRAVSVSAISTAALRRRSLTLGPGIPEALGVR